MVTDIRRHGRLTRAARVLVSWPDGQGNFKFASGRCLDVSRSGLRVELPERVEIRSYVTIRSEELKLACSASVRHCNRRGARFDAGLEFSHPLEHGHPALHLLAAR
jgi:hypothetical protein